MCCLILHRKKHLNFCGVSVERMIEFAHAYAKAKAPFIRLGSGLSRYGNGAMNCRTINALPAVVGAWQHLGGGLLSSASGSKFCWQGSDATGSCGCTSKSD